MKLEEIEPILQQVTAYFRSTNKSCFNRIDYERDEIVEALESMHFIVRKTISNRKIKAKSTEKITPENAGKLWTEDDDKKLEKMFVKNFEPLNPNDFYTAAAKKFKRSKGAIKSRLNHWEFISTPYDTEYAIRTLLKLE